MYGYYSKNQDFILHVALNKCEDLDKVLRENNSNATRSDYHFPDELVNDKDVILLPKDRLYLVHLCAYYDSLECLVLVHQHYKASEFSLFFHCTPLHYACLNGSLECSQYLLENGADANAETDDVFIIISHNYTPLFLAATAGNATLLNTLFNYDAKLDTRGNKLHSPLNQAVQKKRSDCLEILLTRSAKPTNDGLLSPLMQAIVSGLDMAVELLLEKGADINYANSCGKTALYQAIKKNNEKLVAELLDKGANVHYKDNFGTTAIHTAASTGNLNIIKTIIDHGADKNALNNKGQNAVFAALGAPPETFPKLLRFFYDDLGLDINQESKEKDTIFTELLPDTQRLTEETLSFLIQHGADYNKKTKAKGMSIRDIITTTNMFSPAMKDKFNELANAREAREAREAARKFK